LVSLDAADLGRTLSRVRSATSMNNRRPALFRRACTRSARPLSHTGHNAHLWTLHRLWRRRLCLRPPSPVMRPSNAALCHRAKTERRCCVLLCVCVCVCVTGASSRSHPPCASPQPCLPIRGVESRTCPVPVPFPVPFRFRVHPCAPRPIPCGGHWPSRRQSFKVAVTTHTRAAGPGDGSRTGLARIRRVVTLEQRAPLL